MATALAPEKPPLGQKMPWAGSRLENRPLSRRMHREKCRPLVRLASGAPVFANGAVTAAMAYAFNQIPSSREQASAQRPDFENMSNQEFIDWAVENRAALGIELAEGTTVRVVNEYRNWVPGEGWETCLDALCGGALDGPVYGHYDPSESLIELFAPAFEPGLHFFAPSQTKILGIRGLSREAIAVQAFGHEAAHSMGVDMVRDYAPTHYGAERAGLEAMKRFGRLYE